MEKQHVRFVEREDCGPSTGIFRFEKPVGYAFAAGQYFNLTLQTAEDEQTKIFSHCDAPDDDLIELTTRMSGSAFKNALAALAAGDEVTVAGPGGRLTVPPGCSKAGFLVGGVGITPAHSIVRDAVLRSTGLAVALFYGNQDLSCVPFGEEFRRLADEHGEITLVEVLFAPPDAWQGEVGFITADVVRRHVDPFDGWHWFVSGPPAMVTAMEKVVADLALPADAVTFERFGGYA